MKNDRRKTNPILRKAPTGIQGLDELTGGGLPRGGRLYCAAAPAAARR